MRIRDLSIRIKLIGIQLITVIIVLVIGSLALISSGVKGLKKSRLATLSSLCEVVAYNCIAPLDFMDEKGGAEVLASLREESSVTNAVIFNEEDSLFAAYTADSAPEFSFSGPQHIDEGTHAFFDDHLLISRPIMTDNKKLGTLLIRTDLRELKATNREYAKMVLLVLFVSVLFASLIALLFQRSISTPIATLVNKINIITRTGSYDTQTQLNRKDELGVLSEEFDEMLEVIRKKEEQLNRLNEDLESKVDARTAELQEAYAKLRERAEELREVTYVISHDLQTPLRGMFSLTHFLREDLDSTASQDTQEHLDLLTGRVERMHRLTQALINYVEAGRPSGEIIPVDLRKMLKTMLDSFKEEHQFNFSLGEGLPTLKADQKRLFKVFYILVENALLHCDKPTAEIKISAKKQEGSWEFRIRDNGPGIEPQYHQKVFGMFQTLELKDEIGTIGAGLSIAKKIVEEAGGKIGIESPVDGGSVFWFRWKSV